mgnify:CR=1 FL=1
MENILKTEFNVHIKYNLNGATIDRENQNQSWYVLIKSGMLQFLIEI